MLSQSAGRTGSLLFPDAVLVIVVGAAVSRVLRIITLCLHIRSNSQLRRSFKLAYAVRPKLWTQPGPQRQADMRHEFAASMCRTLSCSAASSSPLLASPSRSRRSSSFFRRISCFSWSTFSNLRGAPGSSGFRVYDLGSAPPPPPGRRHAADESEATVRSTVPRGRTWLSSLWQAVNPAAC
jgi:hypothetical protein